MLGGVKPDKPIDAHCPHILPYTSYCLLLLTHVRLQAGVVITTFTMVAFSGKRAEESEKVMQMIQSREWGLLLMDEVHVVPAQV